MFFRKRDIETFEKLEEHIGKGAMIYFAVEEDIVLSTCMAMPLENGTWEICKLASNKHVKHNGAESTVFKAAMEYAIEHGAKRLLKKEN